MLAPDLTLALYHEVVRVCRFPLAIHEEHGVDGTVFTTLLVSLRPVMHDVMTGCDPDILASDCLGN